jgi:hypothetical protein
MKTHDARINLKNNTLPYTASGRIFFVKPAVDLVKRASCIKENKYLFITLET